MESVYHIEETKGRANEKSHSNRVNTWVIVTVMLLLALWIPALIDQIADFHVYRRGILNQPFSTRIGHVVVWALPLLEVSVVALFLIGKKTLRCGAWLSFALLLAFTIYAAVAHVGDWANKYCDCGRLIAKFSWGQHFWFNLFFLSLSSILIYLEHKIRSSKTKGNTTEGGSARRQIHIN